ncbi:glycoside hydrolase family 36 protein [Subtercola vilae]|uniref:Alpha-galactosidase n=1 Tax=Subtercola vilae TaxID=2056433 RepID=A0A4V6U5C4_9MICO|nr:glycoside hydrolase family 36 protein [Subtercola vilae]TIH34854.1 alpha-galactosidase [Subtercola vilae]
MDTSIRRNTIRWNTETISIVIDFSDSAPARISEIALATRRAGLDDRTVVERLQPLVEVMVLGDGHALSNTRFSHTGVGARLRYREHSVSTAGDGRNRLSIVQFDEQTNLAVTSLFEAFDGVAAVQTSTTVTNEGENPQIVQMVSSFATGAFLARGEKMADVSLLRGRSEWCGESRWAWIELHGPDGLPEINTTLHDHDARGTLTTVSKSTWSSGEYLPTGVLENRETGRALAWQIEHNGAWRWEVDGRRDAENAVSLVVSGPTDIDHQWNTSIGAGGHFTSVPVSFAVSDAGYEGAIAGLTAQRRAMRRRSVPDAHMPVIFNDYMNALMGDPTTEKLLPLIDAAAAVGAEYFCVDAGWYDDGGNWWPSVGEWKPSTVRFPDGGLERVLSYIRQKGMQPGLWLEPEVVGVKSPMAGALPPEAFIQRFGERVVEHDRYLLDFRHPATIAHLDRVVDHLVIDEGARYFKLDYNVTPGSGTDLDALSAGEGLLDHNRAHLAWLDGIIARHPNVIFENCASGAMRMDYAMMSRLDLQSTSDQQDYRLYATIAAAAPASLVPEQAANWSYPQPNESDEAIAFNMVNGLAGRLYLSGFLDGMNEHQLALVSHGVDVHKDIRADVAASEPFWPLGLPGWYDDTVVLGLRSAENTYLAVWSRDDGQQSIELTLPSLAAAGESIEVSTLYPVTLGDWHPTWNAGSSLLTVTPASAGPSARLFRLAARA